MLKRICPKLPCIKVLVRYCQKPKRSFSGKCKARIFVKSKFKNCGTTNKITFKMIRCLMVSVILPILLIVKN